MFKSIIFSLLGVVLFPLICNAEKVETSIGSVLFTPVDHKKSVLVNHDQLILFRGKLGESLDVVRLRNEGAKSAECTIATIDSKGGKISAIKIQSFRLFEKYKVSKVKGNEHLIDDGGNLFFSIAGVKVEWSYASPKSSDVLNRVKLGSMKVFLYR